MVSDSMQRISRCKALGDDGGSKWQRMSPVESYLLSLLFANCELRLPDYVRVS